MCCSFIPVLLHTHRGFACRRCPSSRRRALGSGSCLVCSLVARSATHGNSPSNRCNAASGLHGSRGFGKLPRTPLGCLGPPVASPAGGNAGCGQREIIARSAVEGVRSPVGISRLKQADFGQGPAFGGTCGSGAGAGGGLGGMSSGQKDGVFFRPRPRKARSDSWGGYDRRRLTRRTRFDSIPEGLAEEEEEDDLEKEVRGVGLCVYWTKGSESNIGIRLPEIPAMTCIRI